LTTFERLKGLIAEVCAIDATTIAADAGLRGYGVDSVRLTELMLTIEDEFNVVLMPQHMGHVRTVAQLAAFIDEFARGADTRA
jgi:acyl carrier protein